MSKVISPTVGRVVHYFRGLHEMDGKSRRGPLKADVVFVHSDRMVNLSVCDENGVQFGVPSVDFLQPDVTGPGIDKPSSRYCEWMEFQKGQASKTEEAKTELEKFKSELQAKQEAAIKAACDKVNAANPGKDLGCDKPAE